MAKVLLKITWDSDITEEFGELWNDFVNDHFDFTAVNRGNKNLGFETEVWIHGKKQNKNP